MMQIGTEYYPCSFTVLDHAHIDFIFGLDMIRKHQVTLFGCVLRCGLLNSCGLECHLTLALVYVQCMIDLKDNVLRVGGGAVAVPFLQGE